MTNQTRRVRVSLDESEPHLKQSRTVCLRRSSSGSRQTESFQKCLQNLLMFTWQSPPAAWGVTPAIADKVQLILPPRPENTAFLPVQAPWRRREGFKVSFSTDTSRGDRVLVRGGLRGGDGESEDALLRQETTWFKLYNCIRLVQQSGPTCKMLQS